MMGVNLSSGGSLQWWVESVLRGLAGVSEENLYEAVTEEATAIAAGSDGLLFQPYLNGERTPHADPNARGSFVGLGLHHTRGAMTRAIMEGVVFALRDSLEIIQGLDVPVKEIRASGGGSRNPLFRQLQADIFGQKISSLQVEQGPAYGVALLAAVGDGTYANIEAACKATIQLAGSTPTNKKASKRYDQLFPIYQQLYKHLQTDFAALAKFNA